MRRKPVEYSVSSIARSRSPEGFEGWASRKIDSTSWYRDRITRGRCFGSSGSVSSEAGL